MQLLRIIGLFTFLLFAPVILFAKSTTEVPAGLRTAYQQARHQIEVVEKKGKPTRWRAVNPDNHLSLSFDGKGITAYSLKDDWRLSMELTRLGAPEDLKPVNKPAVQVKDQQITYDRGTVREWYINDPKGLEQGFTLDKPLTREQLVLQFALGGDVTPRLIDNGKTLQLITPQGKKLRYEGLKAWDAKGRGLNASLQLKDNVLQLKVAVMDAVYPITIDPWLVEEQKLTPLDRVEFNFFGRATALSGRTALVSARGADDVGVVYVFGSDGNGYWTQKAKLTASDAERGDSIGSSVALSDGTALVGAPLDSNKDSEGYRVAGSAYVFTDGGSGWIQQAKLTTLDSDTARDEQFGTSVALSGNTILVGAPIQKNLAFEYNQNDVKGSGSAYVFTNDGNGNWTQQAKLTVPDTAKTIRFGWSVAISDGVALVGAFGEDGYKGAAYVFIKDDSGAWVQQAKLIPSGLKEMDSFGYSVALFGNTALVGAYSSSRVDDRYPVDPVRPGSAYIFSNDGSGNWAQQARLTPSDGRLLDRFGQSIALSDGIALVGAEVGKNGGSVYVFSDDGSGHWTQQAKLIDSDASASVSNGFGGATFFGGSTVALSGSTALVGKRSEADVFDLSCTTTYALPPNQWRQISLPCDPSLNNTVAAVFGDDVIGTYGVDWVLYRYSGGAYVKLALTDTVSQNLGYWIIQSGANDITLDLPANSLPAPVTDSTGCLATAKGCFEIPLETQAVTHQWNMIGYPFKTNQPLANVRVLTDTGSCASGCDLGTAETQKIVHKQLWTYNGTAYTPVNSGDNLESWVGYWLATLTNADTANPRLLFPKL